MLDVDLGTDFHPLQNEDWRTFEAVGGHHSQDHAALGMIGFVDRDSWSAVVHNDMIVKPVVHLVDSEDFLVGEDPDG